MDKVCFPARRLFPPQDETAMHLANLCADKGSWRELKGCTHAGGMFTAT